MATNTYYRQGGPNSASPSNSRVVSGVATIAAGDTTSAEIVIAAKSSVGLGIPTLATPCAITFQTKAFKSNSAATANYYTLKDASLNTVTISSGSGSAFVPVNELQGWYAFKIVLGAAQATDTLIEFEATEAVGPSSNNLTLEGGSVAISSVIPGTGATNLGKAEDAAHTSGDAGVMALGVRNDSGATHAGTDGDYSAIAVSSKGAVITTPSTVQNGDALSVSAAAFVVPGGQTAFMGVMPHLYNGTNWDRAKGGTAGANLTGTIPVAGSFLSDGSNWARELTASAIGADGANGAFQSAPTSWEWNGSSWDRTRNNMDGTALASAARTATTSSSDITNYNGRGVKVFINATAITATPSVVFTIEAKDPISGTYTAILTSVAITGTGHTVLTLYPGITAAANVSVSDILPRTFRITATHADADSITYSVGYSLIN